MKEDRIDDSHYFEVVGAFFQYDVANLYFNCDRIRGILISHLISYKALACKLKSYLRFLRLQEVNKKAKKENNKTYHRKVIHF